MVNPKLDEFVPREKVIDILYQICYVAVDLPLKYLTVRIRGYQLQNLGTNPSELGPLDLKGKYLPKSKIKEEREKADVDKV